MSNPTLRAGRSTVTHIHDGTTTTSSRFDASELDHSTAGERADSAVAETHSARSAMGYLCTENRVALDVERCESVACNRLLC